MKREEGPEGELDELALFPDSSFRATNARPLHNLNTSSGYDMPLSERIHALDHIILFIGVNSNTCLNTDLWPSLLKNGKIFPKSRYTFAYTEVK